MVVNSKNIRDRMRVSNRCIMERRENKVDRNSRGRRKRMWNRESRCNKKEKVEGNQKNIGKNRLRK